jgi:glucan phosphoethanolaminetransferase (alkaline phosphatase superfamily)
MSLISPERFLFNMANIFLQIASIILILMVSYLNLGIGNQIISYLNNITNDPILSIAIFLIISCIMIIIIIFYVNKRLREQILPRIEPFKEFYLNNLNYYLGKFNNVCIKQIEQIETSCQCVSDMNHYIIQLDVLKKISEISKKSK